jgi:Carboxypeptidase regulatory-like domain
MSGYTPKVAIKVAKPCSESWEAMPGDARVRHCGGCNRDVHNLAAMTPAQIDALLAKPGPLPCMRMVRHQDGSLMTARVESQRSLLQRVSAGFAMTLLTIGATAQTRNASANSNAAVLRGRVVDSEGLPVAHAKVEFLGHEKHVIAVDTDKDGVFVFSGPKGTYAVDVSTSRLHGSNAMKVTLPVGVRELQKPIRLSELVTVEVGEPVTDVAYDFLRTKKANPTQAAETTASQAPATAPQR